MAFRKSTSYNIATGGVASGQPITIATEGFIEPILDVADIEFGGDGSINVTFHWPGTGGLNTYGAVPVISRLNGLNYYTYPANGVVYLSGIAHHVTLLDGEETFYYYPLGQEIFGGATDSEITMNVISAGGITNAGSVDESISITEPITGGLSTTGSAAVDTNLDIGGGITIGGSADVSVTIQSVAPGRGARVRWPKPAPHHFIYKAITQDDIKMSGTADVMFSAVDTLELILPLDRVKIPVKIEFVPDSTKVTLKPQQKFRSYYDDALKPKTFDVTSSGKIKLTGAAEADTVNIYGDILADDEEILEMLFLHDSAVKEYATIAHYDQQLLEVLKDDEEILTLL